jgi:hypothetical protein
MLVTAVRTAGSLIVDQAGQEWESRDVARGIGFPEVVNEKAARTVAACVAVLGVVAIVTGSGVLVVLLALGFLARVLAGPRWSPLALLATKVVAPRLGPPKLVPGPPKRFAQSIGFVLTTAAAVAAIAFDATVLATLLLAVLVVFAVLEAVAGFCAGCWVFARLMRLGVIPEQVCAACGDLQRRPAVHPQ